MDAVYQIKSNYRLYPKQYIEDTLKDAPGSTHIVLEGKHPEGAELVAIGYRYNSKVTLCFVITKNGGLPNISYIIRKLEPLGTEFKSVCCPVTGVLTHLEIQRGKFIILVIEY